ncbi:MAG: hypothetical protein PHO91_01655 [Patescibacteria group bacterium]|nr:hypothetical protein [Patescibacteria group bacterium]
MKAVLSLVLSLVLLGTCITASADYYRPSLEETLVLPGIDPYYFGEFLESGNIVTSPPYQDIFFWVAYHHSGWEKITMILYFPLDLDHEEELDDFCRQRNLSWFYYNLLLDGEHCTVFSFMSAGEDASQELIKQLWHLVDLSFICEINIDY